MSRPPPKPIKPGWHPPLKLEDVALWEDVKKTVKRLSKAKPEPEKAAPSVKALKPAPVPPVLEKRAAPRTMTPPAPSSSFDRTSLRKIKSGKIRIDATLDLHGLRQEAAYDALAGFILSAHRRGHKLLLVITGKGDRFSKSEGVLRSQLPRWLKETELSSKILSFSKAGAHHGGEGAFYVRLRKR